MFRIVALNMGLFSLQEICRISDFPCRGYLMGMCRMLLNVLESQDKPPPKELSVQNVSSAEAEKPWYRRVERHRYNVRSLRQQ